MIIHEEINLGKYTNFKIGGIASKLFIPENIEDLISLMNHYSNIHYLSNGTNILINDQALFENVCLLTKINNNIKHLGDGRFQVGASVTLAKFVKFVNSLGYGGIENMMYIPGSIGGAVVMNAGTGIDKRVYIGNYIESVEFIEDGNRFIYGINECAFAFRNSVFKNQNKIVISIVCKFPPISQFQIKQNIEWKLDSVKKSQDLGFPTFGSIYSVYNSKILKIVFLLFKFRYRKGIKISRKNYNWLINKGNGTYKQALKIINTTINLHRVLRQKIILEVQIWH